MFSDIFLESTVSLLPIEINRSQQEYYFPPNTEPLGELYDNYIVNMDPLWEWDIVWYKDRWSIEFIGQDGVVLSEDPSCKFSNQDNEAAFQDNIYKNIDPDTARAIIEATHHTNFAIHMVSTSANRLTIHFLRRNDIYKDVLTF